jgi:hypothetical protein
MYNNFILINSIIVINKEATESDTNIDNNNDDLAKKILKFLRTIHVLI